MSKKAKPGDALVSMLDDLLRVRHHLERENRPAARRRMLCGDLWTPHSARCPSSSRQPSRALAQPRAEVERAAFARFGGEPHLARLVFIP
jgi:hypothetical protein